MRNHLFRFLSFFVLSAPFLGAAPKYKITDLGLLDKAEMSCPRSINNNGEICGWYREKGDVTDKVFKWSPGAGLQTVSCGIYANCSVIDKEGCLMGVMPADETLPRKMVLFSWHENVGFKIFKECPATCVSSYNDLGQIVFWKDKNLCVLDNRKVINLGALFDYTSPVKINNSGELFGTAKSLKGNSIARYYSLKTKRTYDLGDKGAVCAWDINDSGVCLLGYSFEGLYSLDTWAPEQGIICRFPGKSWGKFNNVGQIISGTWIKDSKAEWEDINKMLDLKSDWRSRFERIDGLIDINNKGQMIGIGTVSGAVKGRYHAVLISPVVGQE